MFKALGYGWVFFVMQMILCNNVYTVWYTILVKAQ